MLRRLAQRLGFLPTVDPDDELAREITAMLIVDHRNLCRSYGPWQTAADLGLHPDAGLREIAYMVTWTACPPLQAWPHVLAVGAESLIVDAALEGFEEFVDAEEAGQQVP